RGGPASLLRRRRALGRLRRPRRTAALLELAGAAAGARVVAPDLRRFAAVGAGARDRAVDEVPAPVDPLEGRDLVVVVAPSLDGVARDELDDALDVARPAGFGAQDVEAEPLGAFGPAPRRLGVGLVARPRREGLGEEVELPLRERAVARPHQALGRVRPGLAAVEGGATRVVRGAAAARTGHRALIPREPGGGNVRAVPAPRRRA